MGEEFCLMLEKIFRQSVYLLKLYQQKVFLLKLIYGGKWLVSCSYNPHNNNISNHLQTVSKSLDLLYLLLVGDFNTERGENCMNDFYMIFMMRYSLSSLIKEQTFDENSANPRGIDLILTNSLRSFQNSSVVEIGLCDFHRMIVTVLKSTFQRLATKIRNYSDCNNFDNGMFQACLFNDLSKEDVGNIEKGLHKFMDNFFSKMSIRV